MRGPMLAPLLALLVGAEAFAGPRRSAFLELASKLRATTFGENPISKVANMLRDLQAEMEDDRDHEQKLFDKYGCWYTTVMGAKKASNAEATDRIEALTAYVDDIESGRIEFSDEGADQKKEVQELMGEIEKATNLRKKDKADFEAAKSEMEKTISALTKALRELEEAMEGAKEGTLLQKGSSLFEAVEIGKTLLSPADSAFLEKSLSKGGAFLQKSLRAPDEKLSKEKTFNMKYKMRSGKIQELIADMKQTFEENLQEAETKESDDVALFEKLMGSKHSQLEQAQEALAALGGEGASRDEAKTEATDEIATLNDQITKDTELMDSLTTDFNDQKGKWKARKKLMTLEITAVSNAIAILTSDEARDTFSKAFDDKKVFNEFMFMQLVANRSNHSRVHSNGTLNATAKSSGNRTAHAGMKPVAKVLAKPKAVAAKPIAKALLKAAKAVSASPSASNRTAQHVHALHQAATALRVHSMGKALKDAAQKIDMAARDDDPFGAVVQMLNKIKEDMAAEATEDHEKKEVCESELTEKTASAQESSNFIDERSRFVNRTQFEVRDLYSTINRTIEEIEDAEWELNDATAARAEQNTAFAKEQAGLEAAIQFIEKAKEALEKFYKDNGLIQLYSGVSFLQTGSLRDTATQPADIIVEAGKEPPPPPAIVVEEYSGHKGNKNIQGIMDDIKGDVQKDLDDLVKNEEDAVKAFEDMKKETEDSISDKMQFKSDCENDIANKLSEISDANNDKLTEKEELDATVDALKTMEPDCDYVFTTLDIRIRNRRIEVEGINKALEALGGDPEEVKIEEPDMEER